MTLQAWRARAAAPTGSGCGVSDLIAAVGRPAFAHTLMQHLACHAPIDFFSVYDLPEQGAPTLFLSGSFGPDLSPDCFRRYLQGLSARDRTFDHAKALASPARHALNYWQESEFPQAHRDAIYSRHHIKERLSLVDRSAGERFMALNLYRFAGPSSLDDAQVDAIEACASAVLACLWRHIELECRNQHPMPQNARSALATLCPQLTGRELDTCASLLCGRTYDGVAVELDLSVATVKTYRARAFDKLKVHSRAELYARLHRLIR